MENISGENISFLQNFYFTSNTHKTHLVPFRQVASNMNLTEVPSNLPDDLDPEPAPEPPVTNNELTTISTFEDENETEIGTGIEHRANSNEKTSWARCMLTDDEEVSSCKC